MNFDRIPERTIPTDELLTDAPSAYRRSEINDVPHGWMVKQISAVAEVKTGPFGSALHERDYVDDGTPIVTVEHLSEHGIIHNILPMVSDADRSRLASYGLRKGDIVFSRVGSIDRNSLIGEEEDGWLFSGRLLRVRTVDNSTYSPYLSYHFHSEPFKRRVRSVAVGQTMASLNTRILNSVYVVLPPMPEQHAIAEALADVDELLAALEKLIDKKRAIKQAAMQQLLTGNARLPGFSGEWKRTRIGNIGVTYGGLSGKRKGDFGNGTARYVSFLGVLENVIVGASHTENVHVAAGESQNLVLRNDLLFNGTSETPSDLAMGAVMGAQLDGVYLNSFCFGLRIRDQDQTIPLFLAYFFRGPVGRALTSTLAQGATRYNMSKSQFLNLELCLPTHDEQRVIASILSDIDAEIAALERRRDKTRAIKQGMMQALLTGLVRLVKPNPASAEHSESVAFAREDVEA